MSYYNTVGLTGTALKEKVQKCKGQAEIVLTLFKETRQKYTPSEIHTLCLRAGFQFPITSIRRCITDLTTMKHLVRLNDKKPGPYKEPEHLWQYRTPAQ